MIKIKRSKNSRTSYHILGLFRPANGSNALVTRKDLVQLRDSIELLLKWEK